MCEKTTGDAGQTREWRPASIESVERLAKKIARLEQSVYDQSNKWARQFVKTPPTNAESWPEVSSSPSNADYATAIEKPYHNHHEHEWFARGSSGQGGNGGPSVSTKEWACYCGATKKEVVTEPNRANL